MSKQANIVAADEKDFEKHKLMFMKDNTVDPMTGKKVRLGMGPYKKLVDKYGDPNEYKKEQGEKKSKSCEEKKHKKRKKQTSTEKIEEEKKKKPKKSKKHTTTEEI